MQHAIMCHPICSASCASHLGSGHSLQLGCPLVAQSCISAGQSLKSSHYWLYFSLPANMKSYKKPRQNVACCLLLNNSITKVWLKDQPSLFAWQAVSGANRADWLWNDFVTTLAVHTVSALSLCMVCCVACECMQVTWLWLPGLVAVASLP